MKLVQAIFLFSCKISYVYPSCPVNEVGMFCDGSDLVPQLYCEGVELNDRWNCNKKKRVRCGCGPRYARQADNTCVPFTSCKINYNLGKHFGIKTHLQITEVQTASTLKSEVLKFLNGTEEIYLESISTNVDEYDRCECLKSTFLGNGIDGVERNIRCYYYVRSEAAHLSHAQVSDNRALITRTLYAAFDVGTNGSETVLSVDYAQLGSGVTHLNEQKLHFHGHFVVLHADAQCLVLELWKDSDGHHQIWSQHRPAEDSCCQKLPGNDRQESRA
ncbi:uncharacterized protein [Dermacentor albipictus]|uniref:uncharacterized protein isoform X2 n=1 Tax=Dermacentor albipictus TaxID=60249 RepID=UPI0031FBF10E